MSASINELDIQELKKEIFRKNIQLNKYEDYNKVHHSKLHRINENQIKKELDTLLYRYYKSMYRQ